jgi:ribonuclease P protein component
MLAKKNRVHLKKQYDSIFRANRKVVTGHMVFFLRQNKLEYNRCGVIASKKVGRAHVRNLAKRRVRQLIRENMESIRGGYDLVVICRAHIDTALYAKLQAELVYALKKGDIYVSPDQHQDDQGLPKHQPSGT